MKQSLNKSFSRRIGKSLSEQQKQIMKEKLEAHLLKPEEARSVTAEIGIGMGEHFINLCKSNPDNTHIGFEPYLNGIANALLLAKKENITNFQLWPNDMDLVFSKLPAESIHKLYILFPDPWPKTKQKKRRIICAERLELFADKIKKDGILYFASDIDDYSNSVVKLLSSSNRFNLIEKSSDAPHEYYIKTKYHQKAEAEGRSPKFYQAIRL